MARHQLKLISSKTLASRFDLGLFGPIRGPFSISAKCINRWLKTASQNFTIIDDTNLQ